MPINESVPGFMSPEELRVLERLAQRVPEDGVIVEIGSLFGRSSWTLAKSCPPSVKVYCVDLWNYTSTDEYDLEEMRGDTQNIEKDFATFQKQTQDCPNIIALQSSSTEVPWPEDLSVDLVFIDGNHQAPYVGDDIEKWLPRIRPSGIISGHDFFPSMFPDVCRAVVAVSERLKLPIQFYPSTSIWFIELNGHIPDTGETLVTNPVIMDWLKEFLDME